jgi:AmmeMemoRadiSam system protein B
VKEIMMGKKCIIPLLVFFGIVAIMASCTTLEHVREPSVAGLYYHSDAVGLRNAVSGYIANAQPVEEINGRLLAIISPHAGYNYSGHIAACGYSRIKDIDTVIIIGPSHKVNFTGASIYSQGKFKTPLGMIPVDKELAKRLLRPESDVRFLPEAYAGEYSIEMQLPLLQVALGEFKILPILLGEPTLEMYEHLTAALTQVLDENEKAIIVASVDLSHYYGYDTALRMDKEVIGALEKISLIETEEVINSGKGEIEGPQTVFKAPRLFSSCSRR